MSAHEQCLSRGLCQCDLSAVALLDPARLAEIREAASGWDTISLHRVASTSSAEVHRRELLLHIAALEADNQELSDEVDRLNVLVEEIR